MSYLIPFISGRFPCVLAVIPLKIIVFKFGFCVLSSLISLLLSLFEWFIETNVNIYSIQCFYFLNLLYGPFNIMQRLSCLIPFIYGRFPCVLAVIPLKIIVFKFGFCVLSSLISLLLSLFEWFIETNVNIYSVQCL